MEQNNQHSFAKENFKLPVICSLAIAITVLLFCLISCVSSKLLEENEYLYAGAKIKVHIDTTLSGKGKLERMLKDETYPLPNRRILGIPYKLWIYSVFENRDLKKNSFIGNNYGERPVLLTDVPMDEVSESLHTVLKANGFLDSRVKPEVIKTRLGKQQRKVLYQCYVEAPYHLRNITIDLKDSAMAFLIDSLKDKTFLHPNAQYNLILLKQERERIDNILKSRGYYYFSPDFLYYLADSSVGKHQIDVSLRMKQDVANSDIKPWYVNKVLVVDNTVKDSVSKEDTIKYKGISFLTSKLLKPKYMRHFFLLREGQLLTSERYSITNKNLSSLAAFKYTNMEAYPDTTLKNTVNLFIDITPNKRNNFRAEANLVSKSNDFAGPGVELGYINRNLFGGGEQLSIKANGSLEAWLSKSGDEVVGNFNYEAGGSVELKFPRYLLFNPSVISARFIPNNHIRLDSRYINQMQFYRMSFFRLIYGYRWIENEFRSHELNLIDITYQHMLGSTSVFDSLISVNPLLKQSFSDQFMVGTNYTFQYAVPDNNPRRFKTSFTGSLDLSGNLLYGIQTLSGKKGTIKEPLRLLGATYAQYIKTTLDYRMYWDISRKDRIASRVSAGLGLPVGNSGVLPGIKQYYLGGANSIRAYRFRSVGPGAYADSSKSDAVLINHSGEIMLLGNIENRFRIAKSLELALFIDAGNIWLAKDDPLRSGAQFKSSSFLKELAIGWGTGLRYLNQYFIIRVDVGFPLHSPNLIQKASDMNSVFNFAIGYPF